MNHRDRDAHSKGFTISHGYTPQCKTNLWQTIAGKAILLACGTIFTLAIIKAVL